MDIKFINTPEPIGNFVNVRYSGNHAYISGQGPFDDNGELIKGRVGEDLDFDQAYDAARRVGISILSVLKNEVGFDFVEGKILPPTKPGLGIELNRDAIKKYQVA